MYSLLCLNLLLILHLSNGGVGGRWNVMPHHDAWSAARQGHIGAVTQNLVRHPPSISCCAPYPQEHRRVPLSRSDELLRHLDEGEMSGVGNPHPPCNPGACTVTNLDPNEIDRASLHVPHAGLGTYARFTKLRPGY
jgi:hypothetical protein